MAASAVAEAMADRPVPLRERKAPWGHAPLRGSRRESAVAPIFAPAELR